MNRIVHRKHPAFVVITTVAVAIAMIVWLLAALLPGASAAPNSIIFVDKYAAPGGDGSSWATAYQHLQDALTAASAGSEIWVAQGVYYPDEGSGVTAGDLSASFVLKSGVSIYGGFTGVETGLSERDPWNSISALSGDIDQDDITGAHGLLETPANITGANSFHVLVGSGADSSAILDGFAVTGGQANGNPANNEHEGGGLFIKSGSPTLNNLIFAGNIADEGGAMALVTSSSPVISNTRFVGNAATDYGGAMHSESSSAKVTNALFSGNRAVTGGGAVSNVTSSPDFTNVTISGNIAGLSVSLASMDPNVVQLAASGGGIFNLGASKPNIDNSIIWNNQDDSGIGTASASIHNQDPGSTPAADYSDIQELANISQLNYDVNSIDQDPLFVSAIDPASAPSIFGDLRLKSGSPAIDAGDDSLNSLSTDLDQQPRIQGAAIDMGAFEASPSSDLSIDKSSNTPSAKEGETITYTYEVINNGIVSVTNISAIDDQLGSIDFGTTELLAGNSVSGTLTYTVAADDIPGPITNTAAISGTVGVSTTVVASDTIAVSLSHRPAITVQISSNISPTQPGDTITYTYDVKNVGDVSLDSVTVTDDRLGLITLDATTLAPGGTTSGSAAYEVEDSDLPGPLTNTATANGISWGGISVEDLDSIAVPLIGPPIIYEYSWTIIRNGHVPVPPPELCENIVENSGFENSSAWHFEPTKYTASYSKVEQNSGERSARTGITKQANNIYSYSSTYQTVKIPADAASAELSYYLFTQSTETSLVNATAKVKSINQYDPKNDPDLQLVIIFDTNFNEIARLYGERRNDRKWILHEDNLINLKGQTINLYFGTINNGQENEGVTSMYVDDVELEVCTDN